LPTSDFSANATSMRSVPADTSEAATLTSACRAQFVRDLLNRGFAVFHILQELFHPSFLNQS
jgi:hypothetical protein